MSADSLKKSIKLLKIPPELRTSGQLEALVKATEDVDFIRTLVAREKTTLAHIEICRRMTYMEFPSNKYIFHMNQPGDALYLILEGTVSVQVPEVVSEEDEERSPKSILWKRASMQLKSNETGMTEIAEITPGGIFGEMALMNNRLRNASILSKTDLKLGKLSKPDFEILNSVYERMYAEKIKFLKQISFFKFWTNVSLQKLSLSMELVHFKRGRDIYLEGDTPQYIYIIKKGQVKLTQKYIMETKLSHKIKNKLNKIDLQIIIKGDFKMFGYEEILNEIDKRANSCVAFTDVDLYRISADEFVKKVHNPVTRQSLEDRGELFSSWQRTRIENLKETEKFKSKLAYSSRPANTKNLPAVKNTSPVKEYSSPIKKRALPRIFMNLMKAPANHRRTRSCNEQPSIFATEIPLV